MEFLATPQAVGGMYMYILYSGGRGWWFHSAPVRYSRQQGRAF